MKRVQLLLPDAVVAWIDAQADGIESRAGFIRRSIVALMKDEQRRRQISRSLPESFGDSSQWHGRVGER